MPGSLKNKTLLILGASWSEIEVVEAARAMGVRTVVTDNHTDWSDAPAKHIADEAWNISWADTSALRARCLNKGVDGCLAGFSERRVTAAQGLCESMGWPFFASGAALDIIQDKVRFREACKAAGVDVAASWDPSDPSIKFPVIVKPADNGGSRGITVVRSSGNLTRALDKAVSNSDSGRVLIEEYLSGDEIMVYYVAHGGVVELSAMCDRHMASFDPAVTQLPVRYVFPSRHLEEFWHSADARFRDLISSLGICDGLVAFQAFALPDGRFVPFDPTYRLDGTMAYHLTDAVNGTSVLRMLIRHSLTGSMDSPEEPPSLENPDFGIPCLELPVLLGPGTISRVSGLEGIRQDSRVVALREIRHVGERLTRKADFTQMLCRVLMRLDPSDVPSNVAKEVLDAVRVEDEWGQDMVIYRADGAVWGGRQ